MKTLKLLTATMLLLVAMAAGAETISDVTIGNLVYSLDTDTKVATVTGYDRSNKPTDVVIPNTIEYGGNYSVTTIGERAFYSCTSLASVNIPNSVTTIGEWAFSNCTSLASIDIPNSVTTIGELAFGYCTSLASISVASDNPNYIGIDGVLFNKDKTMIVVYPAGKDGSEYTIPNSVTTIGEWAFNYCTSLASIDIPNSVTTIGEYAFENCTSLTSIDIPNSVTTIGEGAFRNCTFLASISVASDNPNYIGIDGVLFNKDKTIIVVYPAGKDGSEYTIPNSVTTIGEGAFCGCSSLASIDIPNSVTTIGEWAFAYCSSLASIDIPNSVTTIGEQAFYNCSSLASIDIPNSVTTIGEWTFASCESLASIDIPNSVTTIGEYAFYYCRSLASIDIPNSVTTIGEQAFSYCRSLASVNIPNSVTTIGNYAFRECKSLASVNIPNSVTTIGMLAFYNCKSLASVNIGEAVTTIGGGAFAGCNYITSVTCLAKECPVYDKDSWDDMFYVYKTATLYVPKQSIDAYKTTDPWSNFVHVVALEDTGIEGKPTDNAPRVDAVYDIDGRRTDSMKRGLNIVRMSDGTTRKVMK